MAQNDNPDVLALADDFRRDYAAVKAEIGKAIVGHEAIIDGVLTCMFVGGNALLEGVPGLGKTMLIRALSDALSLDFSRIQFTPDLMPADITGTTIVIENQRPDGTVGREFQFQKGPLFAQIILADEINRATPKTQSAMLEAMQEKSVTVGGTTYAMQKPFFVLATQNPIEQGRHLSIARGPAGPLHAEAGCGLQRPRTADGDSESHHHGRDPRRATGAGRRKNRSLPAAGATSINRSPCAGLRRAGRTGDASRRAVRHLAGQAVFAFRWQSAGRPGLWCWGPQVGALLDGRAHVAVDDITRIMPPVLRHRVLLNFEGTAEGITPDMVVNDIVDNLPVEAAMSAGA